MNRVLIIVGEATETVDTLYPYYRLQEDGFEPIVAGPEKRRYHMVLHEVPPDWDGKVTREFEGYTIQADIAFRDVKPEEYLGIFFSGGRAPEYLRNDPNVKRIVRYFFENNLPVAHICHAPLILATVGVLKGRQSSGFPFVQPDIENAGGTYIDGAGVVDGNMVSARAWSDNPTWMREFLALLRGRSSSPLGNGHSSRQDRLDDRIARLELKVRELEK